MGARHAARHEIARRFLVAAARGEQSAELAAALANATLDAPDVRLASAVLAGGEHAHVRAIELAEAVLAEIRGGEESTGSTRRGRSKA